MTYVFAWALQQGVFAALRADPSLGALIGDRVHDAAPQRDGAGPGPYLLIGDETATPWDTSTDRGAIHEITVSAIAQEPGFATVKRIAAVACAVLLAPPPLTEGRVVSARFLSARTARSRSGETRRVDMRFRFVIENQT